MSNEKKMGEFIEESIISSISIIGSFYPVFSYSCIHLFAESLDKLNLKEQDNKYNKLKGSNKKC